MQRGGVPRAEARPVCYNLRPTVRRRRERSTALSSQRAHTTGAKQQRQAAASTARARKGAGRRSAAAAVGAAAMTRGGQRKQSSLERHEFVFDRKLNAFRKGAASQLPPAPSAAAEDHLPRKLRAAMALQAGALRGRVRTLLLRNALTRARAGLLAARSKGKPVGGAAPVPAAAAAGAAHTRPAKQPAAERTAAPDSGDEPAAKRKFKGAKQRRKRLRRESAADDEEEAAIADAPRFGEVAQAPPSFGALASRCAAVARRTASQAADALACGGAALARKQSLGRLFQKQMAGAAASARPTRPTVRAAGGTRGGQRRLCLTRATPCVCASQDAKERDLLRASVIASYRKLRGHETLPKQLGLLAPVVAAEHARS